MYRIIIEKCEKNPEYEAELAKWEERNGNPYRRNDYPQMPEPSSKITERVLSTFLTDEEFDKIRKACIQVV